ncbi:hypothetical protein Ciccas_001348 [Cichlidogyrus casuarinus]|uniref:CRAL-TRIO domain-containing protein n=1 Tax=Cichlidogyrus casuarinus TaxID=1844966 RepID=A0ABD2QKB2_9PLAT
MSRYHFYIANFFLTVAEIRIEPLSSAELVETARRELNENPETRPEAIAQFKESILNKQGITGCTDDGFLLRFLRARKFKIEKALELYVSYYATRKYYPDIFEGLHPTSIKHVLKDGIVALLPNKDSNGRSIILMRVGLWNPDNFSFTDLFKTNLIIVEELLFSDPSVQVNGIVVVIDLTHFSFRQASNLMSAKFARRAAKFLQETTPIRVRAVHMYNEPSIFTYVFAVLKPFLKAKNQKKVIMHGPSLACLHEHVAPEVLPNNCDLAGLAPPIPDLVSDFLSAGLAGFSSCWSLVAA